MEDEPIKYKRFMVFSSARYEAAGGTDDCVQSFDTKEEAEVFCEELQKTPYWSVTGNWYEVFDRVEGVTVLTA